MAVTKFFEDTFTGAAGPLTAHVPDTQPFSSWEWVEYNYENGTPSLDGSGAVWDSESSTNTFSTYFKKSDNGAAALLDTAQPLKLEVDFLRPVAITADPTNMTSVAVGDYSTGYIQVTWNPYNGRVYVNWTPTSSGDTESKMYTLSTSLASLSLSVELSGVTVSVTGDITDSINVAGGVKIPSSVAVFSACISKDMKLSRLAAFGELLGVDDAIFGDYFEAGGDGSPVALASHTPNLPLPSFAWTGSGLKVNGVAGSGYMNTVGEDGTTQESVATFTTVAIGHLQVQMGITVPSFYTWVTGSPFPSAETIVYGDSGWVKFKWDYDQPTDVLRWRLTVYPPGGPEATWEFNYDSPSGTYDVQSLRATIYNDQIEIAIKGSYSQTPSGLEKVGSATVDMSWLNNLESLKAVMTSGGPAGEATWKYLRLVTSPDLTPPAPDPEYAFMGFSWATLPTLRVGSQLEVPVSVTPRIGQFFNLLAELSSSPSTTRVMKQLVLSYSIKDSVGNQMDISTPMLVTSKVQAQFDIHWLLAPNSQFVAHTPPHITL